MKKSKSIYVKTLLISILILSPCLFIKNNIYADGFIGGEAEGANGGGCANLLRRSNYAWDTCYGATWRSYKIGSTYNFVYEYQGYSNTFAIQSVTFSGDEVTIPTAGYQAGGTVNASACKSIGANEIYILGLEVFSTPGNGYTRNPTGIQAGMTPISDVLDGSVGFKQPSGAISWDSAMDKIEQARINYDVDVSANLGWFCYNENWKEKTVTFSSTSTANASGYSSTTTDNGTTVYSFPKETESVNVSFNHTISSNPSGYANHASYSRLTTKINNSTTDSKRTSGSTVRDTINATLNPGESKRVCQEASYSPTSAKFDSSDNYVDSSNDGSGSSEACVIVYREAEAIISTDSSVMPENDKIFADSTKPNGSMQINFTHTLTRGSDPDYDNWLEFEITPTINGDTDGDTSHTVSLSKERRSQSIDETYTLCNSSSGENCNGVIELGTFDKTICQTISTTSKSHLFYYPGGANDRTPNGTASSEACAHIYRPYNFDLSISLNNIPEIITPNEPVSVTAAVNNNENKDSNQEGVHSYTPDDTTVQIFAIKIDKNTPPPETNDAYEGVSGIETPDIAQYLQDRINGEVTKIEIPNSTGPIGISSANFSGEYEIKSEIPLGTKICFIATVNYTNSSFSTENHGGLVGYGNIEKRYITSPVTCQTVAKKAAFQVWGGSVFGNGSMTATTYVNDDKKVFGSWVDYGITSNGEITKLASAAGYEGGITASETVPAKMTISNSSSPLGNAKLTKKVDNRARLISIYDTAKNAVAAISKTDGPINVSENYNYTKFSSNSFESTIDGKDEYRFTRIASNQKIKAEGQLGIGVTHVIYAGKDSDTDGDLEIVSDFKYDDDNSGNGFINSFYMPQYIIIAEGDINISSNVKQIDAILIAQGKINTCTESNSNDLSVRESCQNNQLKIRGAILANSLDLTRSYSENDEPAERIINSAVTHFWSNTQVENYSNAITTYIHEIAPRY